MTPPQSPPQFDDEDIVISGMSGIYPGCGSIKEFTEKLFSKENMVNDTNQRWTFNHPELSPYGGNLPGLDKFDAQFFMIHYRLCNSMDAMPRKLMEHAYQAIYDSGTNPIELSGKHVGVFVGACTSETEKVSSYANIGFGIVGCNRAMFSNRISYWLNAKGPSMTLDCMCSSSMTALELAYLSMKRGDSVAAVVAGSSIHLHPQTCIHYSRLCQMNPDGKTKSFDMNADGQSMSETISILFLQKYKDAKRVYAKLCHAKTYYHRTEDGPTGQKFTFYRELPISTGFLRKFYDEAKISPKDVEFVEAFGSGIPQCDKAELEAIEDVFCKDRKNPLHVGSVMSNIGYCDAATGIAALTKVCLSFHKGQVPANLHCENPRDDVRALKEGRMKISTDHLPTKRSYIAVNNLSLAGANAHALLHGYHKEKDPSRYQSQIPHLVTISGRQESAVELILKDLKTRPIDPEEIALFHNIHKYRISKHMARGFAILGTNDENETVSLSERVNVYDEAKRPLWFVYSGMGSQWAGMGTQLMKIPVIAESIQRSHKILETKGLDLIHILTTPDKSIYDNILHSFVGIAAIQIALTDALNSLGIVPDKIIGHSVGELGCAYADGCLTAEEMILSAYSRGLVSIQTPFIRGSMAAVGVGYKQILPLCPPEIEVACHNGPESSTISGPAEIMKTFVDSLMAKDIFAKEVPCSNIAYHSRYIKEAGPGLLKYLSEVIKTPRLRTAKWVSTSVPQDKWGLQIAQYSSAEYHTNNLLNPVLFQETARLIPHNAVVVEIAPHGLLQAILKRSLDANCTHVPLTRRGHSDNATFFLEAVGNLFIAGYDPNVSKLYPKVDFPVSTETRSLSHLVEWVHSEKWMLPLYMNANRKFASSADFSIFTQDDEYKYLRGHVVDGELYYPASGILKCVWDTLAMSMNEAKGDLSVVFREVFFHSLPKMLDNEACNFSVELQRGTGQFEVTFEKSIIATGTIAAALPECVFNGTMEKEPDTMPAQDVYRILYEKGYQYGGEFRAINSISTNLKQANVTWTGNWVTFLETLTQIRILQNPGNNLALPSYINELVIDVRKHKMLLSMDSVDDAMEACYFENDRIVKCGGIVIEKMKLTEKPIQKKQDVVIKSLEFVPYFQKEVIDLPTALNVALQMVSENLDKSTICAMEVCTKDQDTVSSSIADYTKDLLGGKLNLIKVNKDHILDPKFKTTPPDVVLFNTHVFDRQVSEDLYHALAHDIYVIVLEESSKSSSFYRVISSAMTPRGRLVVGRWRPSAPTPGSPTVVTVTSPKDLLLLHGMRQKMQQTQTLVVLTAYPPFNGLKDLIKKYKKEQQRCKISLAMVDDSSFQSYQSKQLPDFDLTFNVLLKGAWGGEFFTLNKEMSPAKQNMKLWSPKDGEIQSLQWVEDNFTKNGGVEVSVHYAGLSYLDAKKATLEAQINDGTNEYTYGMDFSGVTKSGERVMGVLHTGAAASTVMAEPLMMWPVPSHWSLEEAATVPLAYAHAFYCFEVVCELRKNRSLLVHGATGALGLAIITLALANGVKVFATVSDVKKKRFLRRMFPQLPEDHIGNSRDPTFYVMVMANTNGEGVNLVLSNLKGSMMKPSLECVSFAGVTIDTHNLHSRDPFSFGMYCLTKERAYRLIDFSTIFTTNNRQEMMTIQHMVAQGISKGYVRPLPRVTYEWNEAPRAFSLLAASRHRGKVLLNLKGNSPSAVSRISFSPTDTQLIITSDKDTMLTIGLIEMLVNRGAKNIVLHCHNDTVYGLGHLKNRIRSWQDLSVNIKYSIQELKTKEQVHSLVIDANKTGVMEGVFIIASDPDDGVESEMSSVLTCLDELTRKLKDVKHFAVISETSEFGRMVCSKRHFDGYPSLMLKLNQIEKFNESGAPVIFEEKNRVFKRKTALEAIEKALGQPKPIAFATPTSAPQSTILEEVYKLPGIKFSRTTGDNQTLKQLGLEREFAHKLADTLNHKFNLTVPKDQIENLTISEIKLMQEKLQSNKEGTITGLKAFIQEIDPDELLANTTVVLLPTLVQNSMLRQDEFDDSQTNIIMVSGLDGLHKNLVSVAERLKLPAVALQLGLDYIHETVQETAQRLTKSVTKILKQNEKFYLLGYSYGALIALEMASIFESEGFEGVVFCADADPETFPKSLENWLNASQGEDLLQDSIIEHMFLLMTGETSEDLTSRLKEAKTWAAKMEVCVKAIYRRVSLSAQYTKYVIEAVYSRIKSARNYDPSRLQKNPLRSKIVLLRSHSQMCSSDSMRKYSKQPISSYDLKTDHARALQDPCCTNIINTHLDSKILEEFDKKNLCNTYLLNADTFVEFTHN